MKRIRYHNLSLYRVIAPISIFTFHIFYIYFSNMISVYGLLSSAVQGFTFLSAFLYSQKKIDKAVPFVKKNILKVIIPAGIALVYMLIINTIMMFVKYEISWQGFIDTWCGYRKENGTLLVQFGNFWYVGLIAGCYCILPFLQKLHGTKWFKYFVAGVVLCDILIAFFFFNSLLFSPFVLGYAFGKRVFNRQVRVEYDRYDYIWIAVCLGLSIGCFFLYDYLFSAISSVKGYGLNGIMMSVSITHCIFGMSVFLFFIQAFKFLNRFEGLTKIFKTTDKLSYTFFLGHEALMTGAMSSFYLTKFDVLNYWIVFLFAVIFAVVIYYTERGISLLKKKK